MDFADMKGIFLDLVEALDLYCSSEDLFYDQDVYRTQRNVMTGYGSDWGLQNWLQNDENARQFVNYDFESSDQSVKDKNDVGSTQLKSL